MAMRSFRDESGATWTVWDTVRSSDTPVKAALTSGWLTFECGSSKRRLAPIPGDWERISEPELVRLLRRAEPVSPAPAPRAWRSAAGEQPPADAPGAEKPALTSAPTAAPTAALAAGSLRTFTDGSGLVWSVWAVRPGLGANAPETADRRRGGSSAGAPHPYTERRLQVRSEFSGGWLAFHGANGARRRLMPIPERWEALPDAELERRCREARPMPDAER